MRNLIEFSSWQGLLSTVLGLVLVTVVAVRMAAGGMLGLEAGKPPPDTDALPGPGARQP